MLAIPTDRSQKGTVRKQRPGSSDECSNHSYEKNELRGLDQSMNNHNGFTTRADQEFHPTLGTVQTTLFKPGQVTTRVPCADVLFAPIWPAETVCLPAVA